MQGPLSIMGRQKAGIESTRGPVHIYFQKSFMMLYQFCLT